MSNGVFNFNFLALLHSEILGGAGHRKRYVLGVLYRENRPKSEVSKCVVS